MRPSPDSDPEQLAQAGLIHLAEQPDLLARFFALTGLHPADLRDRTSDPALLGAVLDFIRGDEEAASAFCASLDIDAETLARARAALPGGDVPHWT